jgi:hypothetical protein
MPFELPRGELSEVIARAPAERPDDPTQARLWRSAALTAIIAELFSMREDGTAAGGARGELPAWLVLDLDAANVDSLYYLLTGRSDAAPQRAYQWLRDRQREFIARITDTLGRAGISVLVVKGAELVERLFAGRAISTQTDVDILVPKRQLEHTRAILRDLGYVHAEYDFESESLVVLDDAAVAAYEERHIELYPFCRAVPFSATIPGVNAENKADFLPFFWSRGGGVFLEALDVHHTLILGSDTSPLFDRAVPSCFPRAMTLCDSDHFWTTAVRFYLEADASDEPANIRDLAYLVVLLRRAGIDWDLVIDIIEDYDVRPAMFYTLRMLDSLRAVSIPRFVFDRLHVHRGSARFDHGCRATRALGWMEPVADELRRFRKRGGS